MEYRLEELQQMLLYIEEQLELQGRIVDDRLLTRRNNIRLMIKQMERDRGIDEIADILQRANGSEIAELAVQLYDAGYRKGELR